MTSLSTVDLGRIGVRLGFRSAVVADADLGVTVAAAREIEELGFGALWLNADRLLERGDEIAAGTNRVVVASSVASIWVYEPAVLASAFQALGRRHPRRFLLGIGVSHKPIVEVAAPEKVYGRPLASMNSWLDELDSCPDRLTVDQRIIAAIGPRMLEVARERSAGSHPYLVPVSHTSDARAVLGPDKLLAPAVAVHVGADARRAREISRAHVGNPYLGLPNYSRNWLRHGFDESDLAAGGSDRLVDALVLSGDAGTVARKIREHLDAGADHVALDVVNEDPSVFPREVLRELASELSSELAKPTL